MQAMFFRFSNPSVLDLLLRLSDVTRLETHLTRSKMETRLPTGESTLLPSGVNKTFPWRYTVPQRF